MSSQGKGKGKDKEPGKDKSEAKSSDQSNDETDVIAKMKAMSEKIKTLGVAVYKWQIACLGLRKSQQREFEGRARNAIPGQLYALLVIGTRHIAEMITADEFAGLSQLGEANFTDWLAAEQWQQGEAKQAGGNDLFKNLQALVDDLSQEHEEFIKECRATIEDFKGLIVGARKDLIWAANTLAGWNGVRPKVAKLDPSLESRAALTSFTPGAGSVNYHAGSLSLERSDVEPSSRKDEIGVVNFTGPAPAADPSSKKSAEGDVEPAATAAPVVMPAIVSSEQQEATFSAAGSMTSLFNSVSRAELAISGSSSSQGEGGSSAPTGGASAGGGELS